MPVLPLKPHWLSGRFSLAIVGTSLLNRNMASTLPAMDSRPIAW